MTIVTWQPQPLPACPCCPLLAADIAKDRPRLLRVAGTLAILEYGLEMAFGTCPRSVVSWEVGEAQLDAARVIIDYGSLAKEVLGKLARGTLNTAAGCDASPQEHLTDAEEEAKTALRTAETAFRSRLAP